VSESPATRATLIFRLRDENDHEAWSDFLRLYGPMLYRFVRSRGLQDADAADVVQDVFRRVGSAINRLDYDKAKGGFRAWLFTITRNRLYTFFEKRNRAGPTGNDTAQLELLSQAADDRDELNEQWELEHLRSLAAVAMETVEEKSDPKTWSAFRLTAIENRSAAEAANELSMSTGAIYVAKSRVLARLRAEIERLESEEEEM
jgi:RNA polymerase sigma-70 factor (ECF subfamily)